MYGGQRFGNPRQPRSMVNLRTAIPAFVSGEANRRSVAVGLEPARSAPCSLPVVWPPFKPRSTDGSVQKFSCTAVLDRGAPLDGAGLLSVDCKGASYELHAA